MKYVQIYVFDVPHSSERRPHVIEINFPDDMASAFVSDCERFRKVLEKYPDGAPVNTAPNQISLFNETQEKKTVQETR